MRHSWFFSHTLSLSILGVIYHKISPVFAASSIRWHHWLFLMLLHICMLRACFIWNDCIFCLERISAFGCLSKETSWHPCTLTTHCSCHQYYHVTQLDETPCGWCPFPCEVWFSLTWLEKLVRALLIWDLLWLVWLILSFVISFFLVYLLFAFFIFSLSKDKHLHLKLTTLSRCIYLSAHLPFPLFNFSILIPPSRHRSITAFAVE